MVKKYTLDQIESGEQARLIPVTSARQKQLAAVSVVLAVFRIVPKFARAMLEEVGAPSGKRARLTAMTEVCFKTPKQTPNNVPRPDGLLVVDRSRARNSRPSSLKSIWSWRGQWARARY